jgi:hypothetical protein
MSHDLFVICDTGVIKGAPIRAISYVEPDDEWDSGYACWSVTPERAADIDGELICINCLLGDHPEAGKGLELVLDTARQPATTTPGTRGEVETDTCSAEAATEDEERGQRRARW